MVETVARSLMLLAVVASAACFRGGEREKEAPPGLPGGLCLAPQPPAAPEPFCEEGQCNLDRNYCFDPTDPCDGFFCGGSDRGMCIPDASFQPNCVCEPGFNNALYDLYCCPDAGVGVIDPRCQSSPGDGGEESGGVDDARGSDESDSSGGT